MILNHGATAGYLNSVSPWTGSDVSVSYDSYGRTQTVSDGTGSRTYSYDAIGCPVGLTTLASVS